MSLPVAALGALIAALLETSVLTELAVAGIKPDLVFVITVVVAMVVGFEEALVWAVVGGLLIDAMAGRPLGATTLALLIVTGLATLAGRLTSPARSITVLAAVFVLSWIFQMLRPGHPGGDERHRSRRRAGDATVGHRSARCRRGRCRDRRHASVGTPLRAGRAAGMVTA